MVLIQNEFEQPLLNFRMIRKPNSSAEWDNYYNLRYKVLRAPWNQPLGSERNDGDLTAEHFAYFENELILGVGRLDIMTQNTSQIRFMAVDNDQQGKGIGKKLMLRMEEIAKGQGSSEIILHAREIAVPFYEKLGFVINEKSHLLFNEIQHYLMSKKI